MQVKEVIRIAFKGEVFFCICGSVKPLKTCLVAEKARKPNCDCHYTHEQWIEVSKKYRYKNGNWRKNGIDDAIKELRGD